MEVQRSQAVEKTCNEGHPQTVALCNYKDIMIRHAEILKIECTSSTKRSC